MKHFIITLTLLLCACTTASSQAQKVQGSISTDTAELNILSIAPDSFPSVAVIFKAESRSGEPVWNLTREQMKATENGLPCEIVSLDPISKNQAINISIVVDHSGSMMLDMSQLYDAYGNALFSVDYMGNVSLSPSYKSPLDYAKRAVKSFIGSFNISKDLVSVTGFSSGVVERVALTHDADRIHSIVEAMKPDGNTALYDGMISGMKELADTPGIKVLVTLTDGEDNMSKHTWKDVVAMAKEHEVQVYIVGLGDVNAKRLKQIAAETGGEFRHTKNSASLNSIYAAISKKIQALYELHYLSPNLSSIDTSRSLSISFEIPNTFLVSNPRSVDLPSEVVTVLQTKERNKSYALAGGVLLVSVVGGGSLFYAYKKRRSTNKTEEV